MDPRADALMNNFTGQWLQLRNLDKVTPDSCCSRTSMTTCVRRSVARRSCSSPASCARTVLHSRCSMPTTPSSMRGWRSTTACAACRLALPSRQVTDPNRQGLLGHASILSMTSVANRTSPVLRGKYIISNLLNTPPLPPRRCAGFSESAPKIVVHSARTARTASRQSSVRLVPPQHRSGGVRPRELRRRGQWRTATPEGLAIDTAGQLSDGTKIDGPARCGRRCWTSPMCSSEPSPRSC